MSQPDLIESGGEHAAAETFRQRHPETFTRYLARRKTVFLVAYAGYVCAYRVRNNFKLTSEALRLAHGWSLSQVGLVLTAVTVAYGFGKFIMGMVVDRCSFPFRPPLDALSRAAPPREPRPFSLPFRRCPRLPAISP